MALPRATVTITFDDGTVRQFQGAVRYQTTTTHAEVEFKDGRRRPYPLETVNIHVIEKDEAWEVMEGRRAP
jgi:hypothetical protein